MAKRLSLLSVGPDGLLYHSHSQRPLRSIIYAENYSFINYDHLKTLIEKIGVDGQMFQISFLTSMAVKVSEENIFIPY